MTVKTVDDHRSGCFTELPQTASFTLGLQENQNIALTNRTLQKAYVRSDLNATHVVKCALLP